MDNGVVVSADGQNSHQPYAQKHTLDQDPEEGQDNNAYEEVNDPDFEFTHM